MAKYLDKVQNLMSAMEHNGFETFDGDRKEACDTVESAIMSFPEYTNTVIRQQVVMKMLPFRDLTTEEFQQTVTQLDTQRRNVHNVAIGNMNLLNRLKEERNLTYIFISHDLSVVRFMSDRVLVMYNGKPVEMNDADELFEHPQNDYTKKLIAALPGIHPKA